MLVERRYHRPTTHQAVENQLAHAHARAPNVVAALQQSIDSQPSYDPSPSPLPATSNTGTSPTTSTPRILPPNPQAPNSPTPMNASPPRPGSRPSYTYTQRDMHWDGYCAIPADAMRFGLAFRAAFGGMNSVQDALRHLPMQEDAEFLAQVDMLEREAIARRQ